MENSRLSLTIIGYGSTSTQPLTENTDKIKYGVKNRRKTVIKVILILINSLKYNR